MINLETANVFDIRLAKSYVPTEADRYVDIHRFVEHFSVSRGAVKNWAQGFYWLKGEKVYYPQGPMPHVKTPGGHFRFNLEECEAWFASEQASR